VPVFGFRFSVKAWGRVFSFQFSVFSKGLGRFRFSAEGKLKTEN
jgi:hypothetical protein